MDGNYIKVERFAVEDPNVDIISNHYYENVGNLKPESVLADLQQVQGKKAYIIGEFGLLNIERLQAIAEQAITRNVDGGQVSGFFIWGLRGHRHNGGYYWHLEPANNKTYSYHIPGFAEGDANQERQVINLVRMSIARMNGENKMIPLPVPLPPVLREVENRADIRWLGAAVGRYYRVERATSAQGPWQVIGNNISDGKNRFDPAKDKLFADTQPLAKGSYYYRVIAINESGESASSNIQSFTQH